MGAILIFIKNRGGQLHPSNGTPVELSWKRNKSMHLKYEFF